MKRVVYYNGATMPAEDAKVSAVDHAHLYGDGLFEGIRVYEGRIFRLDEHLRRLYTGSHTLGFNFDMPIGELKQIIVDTVEAAEATTGMAYIRLNLTRGTGLGLDPKNIDQKPNLMALVSNLALYSPAMYEAGLDLVTVSTRVMPPQCLDPRLKTIGRYVSNIQAKLEANRQGAGEGMMLTVDGFVAEGTGDNLFIVRDGALFTPPAYCGILEGITRGAVMSVARAMGISVEERMLTQFDVYNADEVFLTGTAAEVICSTKVDNRTIADGKQGPITKKLIAAFRELTRTDGVAVG